MRIAVYGATGGLGREIVAESVTRGHHVLAVSRSGDSVAGADGLAADLGDITTFKELARENDVIVISIAPDRTGGSHEPLLEAHRHIIETKVAPRILIVGGAGALEVDGVLIMDAPAFPDMFKPEAGTMKAILDLYRSSTGIDWTVLAPSPEISPGTRTGSYVVGLDSPAGQAISTQDFAVALVDELENPQHRLQRFTVSN